MDGPGTLFPSLSGDEPGENINRPSPPTNEPLVDPKNPIPDYPPHSNFVPEAHRVAEPVQEGAPAPTPAEPVDDPNARPKRRTAAERIAQLTKRWRQAEGTRSQLEVQLQNMTQQLVSNQQRLEQLIASRSAPPSRASNGEFVGDSTDGTPQPGVGPTPVTKDDVRSIVADVIQGIATEQQRKQTEVIRLQQSQQTSFAEAVEEFPELNDRRTRANQLFHEIYANSPLRYQADGPYQIALQVRGILADEATEARVQQSNKVAASVVTPRASGVDAPDSEKQKAVKTYQVLSQRMREIGRLPFEEWKEWRKARDVIRRTT